MWLLIKKNKIILTIFALLLLILGVLFLDNKRIDDYCKQKNDFDGLVGCANRIENPQSAINYLFERLPKIDFVTSTTLSEIPDFFINRNIVLNIEQKDLLRKKLDDCIKIQKSKINDGCEVALKILVNNKKL